MDPFARSQVPWWRRLERRAISAYESDVLATLKRSAGGSASVADIYADPADPLGVMRLNLAEVCLILARVTPPTMQALLASLERGPVALAGAGRYGRYWWIELNCPAERRSTAVVAATHVRLGSWQPMTHAPAGVSA